LKVQKDALKMYRRYLPTLTLKKQQLQAEIRTIEAKARAVRKEKEGLEKGFRDWIAVFSEKDAFPEGVITVSNIRKESGNIAGVAIPTFDGADFSRGDYDLYETPLWVDIAADHMEKAMLLDMEAEVLDEQVRLLEEELRATSQRVNLFEKVKIPETEENIRKISIYLADQQVSAVVRSKISKRKIALRNAEASERQVYSL
ncbi:MAG: V-type ATP synthase subunit D, partial [Eubacterium sp.]|nr:V-type ATP synthase subunit D [Eubacterium sp.]